MPRSGDGLLARLAGPDPIPAGNVAVIVAHSDDESIGLGGQLPRLPGIRILHVTNSSPRNLAWANRRGFTTAEEYAAHRQRELKTAMAIAGVPASALSSLGVTDQDAALHLADIARRIAAFCLDHGIATVATHAWEGGHPDHEATAFSVRAAADLIARRDPAKAPAIIEMPYYRAGESGWLTQSFLPHPECDEVVLSLDEAQRALKARLYEAHASQAAILALFPIGEERLRPAPRHDFAGIPHEGELLYEREDWGMTRERWRALVTAAEAELRETTL